MKKIFTTLALAGLMLSCTSDKDKIEIKEEDAYNLAYEKSTELATRVIEAESHEEFCKARAELEAYEEAFRTQIGGEEYDAFISTCNEILGNI